MEKNLKDIRWRQRFANFEKAYQQLQLVLKKDTEHDPLFRAALIQTFEFLFELSWKTMKDKLESEGFVVKNPRETIQQALQSGYIEDGESWIRAMDTRNDLSHIYDEAVSVAAEKKIREDYARLFKGLYDYLKKSL